MKVLLKTNEELFSKKALKGKNEKLAKKIALDRKNELLTRRALNVENKNYINRKH